MSNLNQSLQRRRRFLKSVAITSAIAATGSVDAAQSMSNSSVVIELFTSQGCSSCPPADRVLADLVDRHENEGLAVLALSFHVDYWNYLGWSDPFSSAKWSRRQKQYASVLNENRVYTPQMLINGQQGFVGSRRKQLDANLPKHLEQLPEHSIKLETRLDSVGQVQVAYEVKGAGEGKLINIAVVSRSLTATAARGENRGRKLTHANVVRDFANRKLDDLAGEILFDVPTETETTHSVIAYVQDVRGAAITGAQEKSLSV